MDLYDAAGGCSVLRTFQGWLSMSETGPNEGTLKFYPGIKLSSAYSILRPFFRKNDRGDAWELDLDSSTFPGSALGRAQEFFDGPSGSTHPDLELPETMVSIPRVQPGDAVFWHCGTSIFSALPLRAQLKRRADGIHAVEASHEGWSDSSVLYIPSAPLTLANARYLARQRASFLSGRPPPDLPGGAGESKFEGRGRDKDVVDLDARRAMGLEPFEEVGEAAPLIKEANRILGFV